MGSDKESSGQRSRSRHEDRSSQRRKACSPRHKRSHRSSSSSHKGRESSRSQSPSEKHRNRKRSSIRKENRSRSRSPVTTQRDSKDKEDPNVCHCLGVFGLSSYTQEKDLREVFSQYGDIDDICIIYDRQSGHSKGYGFVYFASTSDAIQARKGSQGLVLDRRPIRVDYSFTLRPHSPTPGRYLGRRSGRDLDKYYGDSGDYDDHSFYRDNRRNNYRDRHYRDYNDSYLDDYDDGYSRHSRRYSPYSRRH